MQFYNAANIDGIICLADFKICHGLGHEYEPYQNSRNELYRFATRYSYATPVSTLCRMGGK